MATLDTDAQGLERALTRAVTNPNGFAPNPSLAEDCVRYLLRCVGEDPTREGLVDTPRRWCKALAEMTSGRMVEPDAVLSTVFNERYDEMVLVRNIRYTSMCEHHLLPFSGEMTVGYVPGEKVVGLSKIPRLVEVLSRRASMQERVTREVAETIARVLNPQGVGVVARAHHSCMGCRGVRQPDADMVTSSMLGCLRDGPARAEFLGLAGLRTP